MNPTASDADWSIRMPKAAELVADRLREQIIREEFSEGELLPNEKEMLQRLGISRPTLREAYRVLESEGMIAITRGVNGGARVQEPSSAAAARYTGMLLQRLGVTLDELCELRATIQVPSVGVLTERKDPTHTAKLKALLDEQAERNASPERMARTMTSFHQMVVRLAGNRAVTVFSDMVELVFDAGTRNLVRRQAELGDHDMVDAAHASHGHLISLIEAGDPDAARDYWHTHLIAAGQIMISELGPDSPIDVLGR